MGNSLGGKKTAKIMKINGETLKFKTPIKVSEVLKNYPGHVVLDSEAVKQFGIRTKPLDAFQNLQHKRLYFLVELPKFPQDHQHRAPRRARSGIHMTAKDRLESLMLSKRSVSDLSIMRPATRIEMDGPHDTVSKDGIATSGVGAGLRVRMRLPKAEIERLMSQSKDQVEVAKKIIDMYASKTGQIAPKSNVINGNANGYTSLKGKEVVNNDSSFLDQSLALSPAGYKKRVGFMPIRKAEIGLVAS